MTWQRGQREVEDLLAQGALEPVRGAAADGTTRRVSRARHYSHSKVCARGQVATT